MPRFAIINGTSQVAEAVLDAAVAQGVAAADLVAVCRNPDKAKVGAAGRLGVEIRKADFSDQDAMTAAFAGTERLLLVPTIDAPGVRAGQWERAVTAAKAAGVAHVLSYSFVGTNPNSPFVPMPFYLFQESLLRVSGLNWTILRFSFYAEPIGDWLPEIVKMGTVPYPSGTGKVAYVTRADAGRAAAAAWTTPGHHGITYNLTGEKAYSNTDLCKLLSKVTGSKIEDRKASKDEYVRVCDEAGDPHDFTLLLATLYEHQRMGFAAIASKDIKKLTGKAPEPFEQTMAKMWQQRQNQGE